MKKTSKVSMQDIANHLNISKNAVSLAINGKPGVSEETRNMVISVAKDLGYKGLDRIENKKSENIVVLIPEYIINDSYFYNEIYWAIENESRNEGYNAFIASVSPEMEESGEIPNIYHSLDCIGIITVGVFTEKYIKGIKKLDIPIISVDNYYDNVEVSSVVTANLEGSFTIVNYLINQGHEKIGFVGPINVTSSIFDRWAGYLKAMNKANLYVDPKFCMIDDSARDNLMSDVEGMEERISKLEEYPTAWVCAGDRIAMALISALSKKGIRVPDDVSVVGFDDIASSAVIVPPLTTMRVRRADLAKVAVKRLINYNKDYLRFTNISVISELIERDSVKKLTLDNK